MRIETYLNCYRAHLLRHGILGVRGARLAEELEDHARRALEQNLAKGLAPEAAQLQVQIQLGEPATLARQAASILHRRSWWVRHPCLGSLSWFIFGTVGSLLPFAFLIVLCKLPVFHSPIESKFWETVIANLAPMWCNWIPLLLGVAALHWWGRRSACGWRALFLASIAIGFAASNLQSYTYLIEAPHSKLDGRFCMTSELGPHFHLAQIAFEQLFFSNPKETLAGAWSAICFHGGISLGQFVLPLLFVYGWQQRIRRQADRLLKAT